jgi:hypothetical protein
VIFKKALGVALRRRKKKKEHREGEEQGSQLFGHC